MAKSPAAIIYNSAGTEQILATEAKLEAVRVLIAALGAEDFATETTLDAFLTAFGNEDFASQTTLAALLAAFNGEDFATETTLAALKAAFDAADFASQATLAALLAAFNGEDFASQTTLAALKASFDAVDFSTETTLDSLLTAFNAEDFATQTTLAALLAAFNGEDFASQTTLASLLSAFNGEDFASETTLAAFKAAFDSRDLATQTTLALADGRLTTIDAVLDSIKDTDGIKKITDQLPAGTNEIGKVAQGTKASLANAWPTVVTDAAGNAISSQDDAGTRRLEIAGKVSVTGASPPPSTNPATILAATPLSVGTHDTTFVIPNGQTYYLQEVIAGNEDPTKGAVVEVIYFNGTEHVVARQYTAGFTITEGFPNRGIARDGTAMTGNVGGTNTILVRRTKYAGSNIAIDAVVRGYTL